MFFPLYIVVALLYEGPGNFASGQSGEIMSQDQFTRQISVQVKQSITEELDLFRQAFHQEQAQVLRNAMKEVLPEMEQRIVENISAKLDAGKETAPPESKSDSGSGKVSPDFPIQIPQRRLPMQIPQRRFLGYSGQVSDESRLLRRSIGFSVFPEKFYEEPDIPGRKQTPGVLPIKPSEGKKLYTKKSRGGSLKQTPDLAICSSSSDSVSCKVFIVSIRVLDRLK